MYDPQLRKDGTLFYNELYIAPVRDASGNLKHFVGIQNDVTERRRLEEELSYQAFHDPLTCLPNRSLFVDRLDKALSRAGAATSRSAWPSWTWTTARP